MKYRRRAVVIDAERFFPDRLPWPPGVVEDASSPTGYVIHTLESKEHGHVVTPGDFVITGVQGERYACKPDIFEKTYEPAPEGT